MICALLKQLKLYSFICDSIMIATYDLVQQIKYKKPMLNNHKLPTKSNCAYHILYLSNNTYLLTCTRYLCSNNNLIVVKTSQCIPFVIQINFARIHNSQLLLCICVCALQQLTNQ